jgi:hypothetical protein
MSWAKVDDRFFAHWKVQELTFAARGLWVTALSWAAAMETDGYVPRTTLRLLGGAEPDTSSLAAELTRCGLWSEEPGGYRFHDYLDHNPAASDLKAQRARNAARQRLSRDRHALRSGPVTLPRPDPTRPIRDLPSSREESPSDQLPLLTREAPHDLVALWNGEAPHLPAVRELTRQRGRTAGARLREHPLTYWREVIRRLDASPFCRGENDRGWRATFDFLLRPTTGARALEGAYDDAEAVRVEEIAAQLRAERRPA